MNSTVKPKVVLSKCLEIEACRYNGQLIPNVFVEKLTPYVEYVPICPEVEIGLGVPRDPVRIVSKDSELRLYQPTSGMDITEKMRNFSNSFLDSLNEVDGFILKSRSPSCGPRDVKVYSFSEKTNPLGRGHGFFAGAVLERFAHLALEDEGRLHNYSIREHFLTKLFTLTRFRHLKKNGKMVDLVKFHTENKLLYMAYNQKELKNLGRITANPDRFGYKEVLKLYENHLYLLLHKSPRYTSNINVLMHSLGYFSKKLDAKEKSYFLDTLEKYRNEKVPLSVPISLIRAWIIRFDERYLAQQSYFNAYPEDLMEITDSGKGRSLKK